MFNAKYEQLRRKYDIQRQDYERKLKQQEEDCERELEQQKEDYERKLEFFKDDEIDKLRKEIRVAKEQLGLIRKENEMHKKITNINGDIIDIKSLVEKLIGKLPQIDLKSLTIHNKE